MKDWLKCTYRAENYSSFAIYLYQTRELPELQTENA